MKTKFRLASQICTAVLAISFVHAQEFRSTVTDTVSDPANARVANATVVATEVQTGTKAQTVSDSAGQYTPFLQPGEYSISLQASGFKEFVRKSVHAGSGDRVSIDIPLEVGNTRIVNRRSEAGPGGIPACPSHQRAVRSRHRGGLLRILRRRFCARRLACAQEFHC